MRRLESTKQGQPHFRLTIDRYNRDCLWSAIGGEVAAALWNALHEKPNGSESAHFASWLDRASDLEDWFEAPIWLFGTLQVSLVAVAKRTVIEEPSLLDTQREGARIGTEFPSLRANDFDIALPGPASTLLDHHRFWLQFDHYQYRSRCRGRLRLLLLVALHDVFEQPPHSADVLEWLLAAVDRPWLFLEIGLHFTYRLRQHTALLLCDLRTATLGMHLIDAIEVRPTLRYPSFGDEDANDTRRLQSEIWQNALEVLVRTCELTHDTNPDDIGRVLAHTLLLTCQPPYRRGSDEAGQRASRKAVVCKTAARFSDLIRLAILADPSLEPKSSYDAIPHNHLQALFALIEHAADPVEKTALARALNGMYLQVLDRWRFAADGKLMYWSRRSAQIAQFPWHLVLETLSDAAKQNSMLEVRVVDDTEFFHNIGKASGLTDPLTREDSEEYYLAWGYRVRTHLDLMLRAYRAPSIAPTLKPMIEECVTVLLSRCVSPSRRRGRLGLFDPQFELFPEEGDDRQPLAIRTMAVLNNFTLFQCQAAFKVWVNRTVDAVELLGLHEHALPEAVKKRALERLESVSPARLLRGAGLHSYEQLLVGAVNAGRVEFARAVLRSGDQAIVRDGSRASWNVLSSRMQLALAYYSNDLTTLENVTAPRITQPVENRSPEAIAGEFETTRQFFRGALLLTDQPREAASIFDALLKVDPSLGSAAVNRFAADIAVAKSHENPEDQRNLFERALERWKAASLTLGDAWLQTARRHIFYSILVADDALQLDLEFDATWNAAPEELRRYAAHIEVAVANARRRGQEERARALIESVRTLQVLSDGTVAPLWLTFETSVQSVGFSEPIVTAVTAVEMGGVVDISTLLARIYRLKLLEYIQVFGRSPNTVEEFIYEHLLAACKEFFERWHLYKRMPSYENHINDFLFSLLRMRLGYRWSVGDQSRGGSSGAGSDAGERDAIICFDSTPHAIVEALVLGFAEKSKIESHLSKAMSEYNPSGLSAVFMLVYYRGTRFEEFWQRYFNVIDTMSVNGCELQKNERQPFPEEELNAANIRVTRDAYRRNSRAIRVFHIGVHLT